MKINDLLKILHGDIAHIDEVDESDGAEFGMRVIVTPIDVKKMLEKYLAGEISAEELIKWAEFMCFRTEYVPPDQKNEDEDPDYYEDMWYVVQRISTPYLDGEVNEARIKLYLSELDKFFK